MPATVSLQASARAATTMFLAVSLAACTGLQTEQKPTTQLGNAIAAAADAQQAVYKNDITLEQNRADAAERQAKWLLGDFSAREPSTNLQQKQDEYAVRLKLLAALRAYGALMTAIASSTADKTIDDAATKIGGDVKAFPVAAGDKAGLAQGGDLAATIVDGLGKLVIDHATGAQLQKAANSVQPNLQKIVTILDAENEDILASDAELNRQIMKISASFETKMVTQSGVRFGDRYRDARTTRQDFEKLQLPADPAPIRAAWSTVLTANAAVAAQSSDLLSLTQEAYDRAKQAQDFYSGLSK